MQKLFFITLVACFGYVSAQNTPTPFLPEIFGQFPNVRDFAMSNFGDEIYFTVESYKKEYSAIYFIKKTKNKWSKPEVAPFSGQYKDLEPFLSPDQLTLFFVSKRPVNGQRKSDADIWYVKRTAINTSWSEARHIDDTLVNTSKDEYYPAVSANGNLYFTRESEDPKRKEDIYISLFNEGEYVPPVPLADSINGKTFEFNAYVSPDEKFLLFTSYGRADDMGGSDLYISNKNANGVWSAAQNLGPGINSKKIDFCPFVDWKNKVLYFTSERNAVKMEFETPQNAQQLDQVFRQYSNGLSRIYSVPFDPK